AVEVRDHLAALRGRVGGRPAPVPAAGGGSQGHEAQHADDLLHPSGPHGSGAPCHGCATTAPLNLVKGRPTACGTIDRAAEWKNHGAPEGPVAPATRPSVGRPSI